ncbi:threonine ammonia-lyase [Halobacterium salinarum]|uniref:threonine ammonia-lyase n=1 Tax=Halobacterium salinarum (strain ATCC 33171 / DSM 3754 / JCM 8978 / NBRC 102687 / NCIMB 764 / 91-R6) TaxID=2597657 RepID=A0A4D6GVB7_HALS9|nr:threonine ammonia-lyase [Halobacterium salinarum]MCF2207355.1 threonine ammonia-lyase [Halobacterium salinarum]MCF2241409.1 threonine ammonia-lyase [Halobacterium salinarum]MDL0125224.1 threonine ammonia-lyase [Halobacterium salinarum]MDL0139780.1 threonine ammonia-lyase [Halobacterium salinarum]MDL0145770.1 threonine ammonia-lyase [Halobacterium salinarum]
MLSLSDIRDARERVSETARHTPLEYSHTFSDLTGADVRPKLECFQRTGSFKIRGATNRIRTLSADQQDAGVVTASAGNHAQGVALAASRSGVDSKVVMPESAPISKIKATKSYGAEVVLHGADYDDAQAHAHELEAAEGRTYVHAFDDEYIMAGQGTLGLEIAADCPTVDTVVVPIGGGGLISGVATALKGELDDVRVIGVQAEGASTVARSLDKGQPQAVDHVDTIADGIAVRQVGAQTFPVIQEYVDEVVTVSDDEIATALVLLLERGKTLVEGAGATALAAVLEDKFEYADGETIVPALCGGNIDLNLLTTVIVRGLVDQGRYVKIRTVLKDSPGSLNDLLATAAEERANIYAIQHDRTNRDIAMNATEVELDLETRGPEHVDRLLTRIQDEGFDVTVLNGPQIVSE